MSILSQRPKRAFQGLSIVSAIALLILLLVTTDPMGDTVFFFQQIRYYSVLMDFMTIVSGVIGFLYFFILPGLPIMLKPNTPWISKNPMTFLVVVIFSAMGNYAILLAGMLSDVPSIGIVSPLFLFLIFLLLKVFFSDKMRFPDDNECMGGSARPFVKATAITRLSLFLVIALSLFIRFVIFNSNVVEYSDVIVYHTQIVSMSLNNYIFNPSFSARGPLYPLFGFLFTFFTPSPLASMKTISFIFSLALYVPSYCLIVRLAEKRNGSFVVYAFTVLFFIFPWSVMLSAIALQDILLTFFVVSFFALISNDGGAKFTYSAAIAAGLAFLCRYSLGILGPLGFLYLVVRFGTTRAKSAILYGSIWAGIVGSWIVRNFVVAGTLLSTTDEALFHMTNLLPGIIEITKKLGMDRHGINSPTFWIPVIAIVLYSLIIGAERDRIRQFISLDYILIYSATAAQIFTLSLFVSRQTRFLLSIAWFIPIIWVILADSYELPGRFILIGSWIVFGVFHIFNIVRNYWVFYLGRLPIGDFTGPTLIVEATWPSISNLTMIGTSLLLVLCFAVIIIKLVLPKHEADI